MNSLISELKARYTITQAWPDLGFAGEPAKTCRSPFPAEHQHGDNHPSFSVFSDGTRWKNHATGEGGDVFDLVRKARGTDIAHAVEWVRERLDIARAPVATARGRPGPELRPGTVGERARLAALRNLSLGAVILAGERGFLHFGILWGSSFWAITDQRRRLVEYRRLDGKPWPAFGHLTERKSHCMGNGKDWPIGTLESAPARTVVWLEGAPDLLAYFHFALIEGRAETVAPVAMLGAANHRVAGDALARFHGKQVVLYPHLDDAGQIAAKAWARQLRDAGATVSAFDLSGFTTVAGKPGKDLNDLSFISGDSYEDPENFRFREVLP